MRQRAPVVTGAFLRHGFGRPLPGGSGTTNDGNTARRFFQDPELTSRITRIDRGLLHRFSVLLRAISSSFLLNEEAYHAYALETAKEYVRLYGWYQMPVAVHKLLLHTATVSSGMALPIGALSEEAQEARNKDFKSIRAHHARQMSRVVSNQDLICRLMDTSDPVISTLRSVSDRGGRSSIFRASLPAEVQALLRPPSPEE